METRSKTKRLDEDERNSERATGRQPGEGTRVLALEKLVFLLLLLLLLPFLLKVLWLRLRRLC